MVGETIANGLALEAVDQTVAEIFGKEDLRSGDVVVLENRWRRCKGGTAKATGSLWRGLREWLLGLEKIGLLSMSRTQLESQDGISEYCHCECLPLLFSAIVVLSMIKIEGDDGRRTGRGLDCSIPPQKLKLRGTGMVRILDYGG
ncbi:hypothetical protein F0562_017741 [Nyssa sinensis]|uniref:Uncharacterized protein n=1 Tax=Nyssa sinensis TaxID=561372 RepID=A0A5J4ZIW1_9ASTE|nr:hypothetical protein F0562_017741 [Nyssa sinensis]